MCLLVTFLPPPSLVASYRLALDDHAPLTTFRVSGPAAPWFTKELEGRVRERGRPFKQNSRAGSLLGYATYREFRDRLTRDMRGARLSYWLSRLNDVHGPNLLWGQLRNLGLVKSSLPSSLQFFGAEELNAFHVSVSSSCPPCTYDDPALILNTDLSLTNLSRPLFEFGAISAAMVHEQIEALSLESHSFGPDGISPFCVRTTFPVILEFATNLFNLSVQLSQLRSL